MKFEDLPRDGVGGVVIEEVEFPVEIPLLRPVEADGAKLESVTLREPTAADIELCHRHGHDATRMVHLLAMLGDLSPGQVRALKGVDFMRASKLVSDFL
ncbi:MAG: phage tail assembly protein [Bryobacterales bacterium]|nr:phage tail assembly protein [Bryobacterales bacterium]